MTTTQLRSRRRADLALVFWAGILQGLAFVAVPAVSPVLQDEDRIGLTSTEYGSLFVPMVILAIAASIGSVRLASICGRRTIFLAGISLNLLAMAFVALSQPLSGTSLGPYAPLLIGMACLGLGVALTVAALNAHVLILFNVGSAAGIISLHAVMGGGNALAPLLAALFLGLDRWWLLPITVGAGLLLLLVAGTRHKHWSEAPKANPDQRLPKHDRQGVPLAFLGFAAIAAAYGVSEALFASWGPTFLHEDKGLSDSTADLALSAFWTMVMIGRILAIIASTKLSARAIYLGQSVLLVIAFVVVPPIDGAVANVAAFGLAGLACSTWFPLTMNFSSLRSSRMAELSPGGLIAALMVGVGIGAFGVGPLRAAVGLSAIYTTAIGLALAMAVMALVMTAGSRTEAGSRPQGTTSP